MKRSLTVSAALAACLGGIATGQWMLGSVACRDVIGLLFGRGHLLALAHGYGIYEADLDRTIAERREAVGQSQDRHAMESRAQILRWLIANSAVRALARKEKIAPGEIDLAVDLVRWQFRDAKEWRSALRKSGLTAGSLRRMLFDDTRADQWVRRRIESEIQILPDESRAFFEAHPQAFFQPERFRASHLFLAAPPETAPDILDQKRAKIQELAQRLAAGEDFFELVALESEDEATKARGGDLGFFDESRMPPDFFAAVRKSQPGQISPPIRTQLGFHIILVTDFKPARQMGFDEVEPEIARSLQNRKQQSAVSYLPAALISQAEFVRP